MTSLAFLTGIILATLWGDSALAMDVSGAIAAVGPTLSAGGGNFGGIVKSVAESFIPLVAGAALLAMTISGFFLAISGNEQQTTMARRVFLSSLAGLALINLASIFASSLISNTFSVDPATLAPGGSSILSNPTGSATNIQTEALGLVAFLEVPLGILCVIMIIISGIRAIANFGSEDGVAQLRRTVLFVVAGFILVFSRISLGTGIASGSPTNIINLLLSTVTKIIAFAGAIAFGMIVYAGVLMVVNIGREEQYTKAKTLILRVGIGLIIIFASGGIVYLLTSLV
ncbi:MAG: hypothetical protein Greene041662_424 [Candidatus Peregrinibacteria bacterium Greene0416_62]|nr:MAG: hypothetical protein Greene041662_424 [Candidatus Peregrinibacteria bacterium Greene0416_62]TSD00374.1 MAG: hypothetical protein Greene101449_173 [Candidatus Peregrinibacteria bacterium Greene1014_49]